jgi:hypothetical protein
MLHTHHNYHDEVDGIVGSQLYHAHGLWPRGEEL